MAKVKFLVKTKGNPSQIYVRFYHSRSFDTTCGSNLLVNPKYWSNKQQRVKATMENPFDANLNKKLDGLKERIILLYNTSYNNGEEINSNWLKKTVAKFHNQPIKNEDNDRFLLYSYFKSFIVKASTKINPATGLLLDKKTVAKYNSTANLIKDFEEINKTKLRFNSLDENFHFSIIDFLKNIKMLSSTTCNKHINIIKMVCRQAKAEQINVNQYVLSKTFYVKRDKTYDPYLNESEIQKIFDLEYNKNPRLDNARDWLIIGVWTGLRISDISRLTKLNITDNKIEITTSKTNARAIIPIHHNVKYILEKRNGEFPNKISDQKFNEYIKEVAKDAEITDEIFGGKMIKIELTKDETAFRKILDYYPKNELVTSHICRRSFATNHYGKIPNKTIMAITTHTSEVQFEKYLKQTQIEHVEKLEKLWAQ